MNKEIFKVNQEEYRNFVEQLKRGTVMRELDEYTNVERFYGTISNKVLCEKHIINNGEDVEYYIFEIPDKEESVPPRPKRKIELTNPKEVQLFYNMLQQIYKDHKNG